jgi:hypothetical protein
VVLDNLRLVGWGIALIVLQELVAYAFNWPSVWQRRDQLGHPDGDPGRRAGAGPSPARQVVSG